MELGGDDAVYRMFTAFICSPGDLIKIGHEGSK